MMKSELSRIDKTTTAKLQGKPKWLKPVMRTISFIGHPILLTPIAFIVGLYNFKIDNTRVGWMVMFGCVAILLNALLKMILRRSRPDTHYSRRMWPKTYSFPSGHSFTATVIYGMAAYYAYVSMAFPCSLISVIALIFMTFAVGYTRIYLGAHYLLDVVGGWILGLSVVILLIYFIRL